MRGFAQLALLAAAASACGMVEVDPTGGPTGDDTGSADVDASPSVHRESDAHADIDASPTVDAGRCPPGHVREAGACVDVVAALHGRRLEAYCVRDIEDPALCRSTVAAPWNGTAGGEPGARYRVILRVRGAVEIAPYKEGSQDGYFYMGGEPAKPDFNVFHMRIASTHYYFNAGEATLGRLWHLDYVVAIVVEAGDDLLVEPLDEDVAMLRNRDGTGPIVVPDIAPAPEPFNGQFIQLDVEDVEPSTEP